MLSKTNLQKRNYELASNERKNKMVQRRCWIEKKNQSRVLTITSRFLQIVKIYMNDILGYLKVLQKSYLWM